MAAYVFERGMTVQDYSRLLSTNPERIFNEGGGLLDRVWEVSFNHLSPNAIEILYLCSALENEDIPVSLLRGGLKEIAWMKGLLILHSPTRSGRANQKRR